jgi:hypothetical protein
MHINLPIPILKDLTRINNFPNKFCQYNINEQKLYIINNLNSINLHDTTTRINYNTWQFYKKYDFNIKLEKIKKKYYIIINENLIQVRSQDYFFINFVNKLSKKKKIKEWFDEDTGYIESNKIKIEDNITTYNGNKRYRVDYLFHLSENNYIGIEFFENAHKNKDDPEYKIEKNRIYSIINDNDLKIKKILCFGVYWEEHLEDESKFKKFVNTFYKKYKEYININNEREYCINGINKYINNKIFAESIYDAKNSNKCVISIDIINSVIKWKNQKYINIHISEFKNNINKLVSIKINENDNNNDILNLDLDLDDDDDEDLEKDNKLNITDFYENNNLSLRGLTRYLKINQDYLLNIVEEEKLLELYTNITIGMVEGLQQQRNTILNLNNHLIFGLDE